MVNNASGDVYRWEVMHKAYDCVGDQFITSFTERRSRSLAERIVEVFKAFKAILSCQFHQLREISFKKHVTRTRTEFADVPGGDFFSYFNDVLPPIYQTDRTLKAGEFDMRHTQGRLREERIDYVAYHRGGGSIDSEEVIDENGNRIYSIYDMIFADFAQRYIEKVIIPIDSRQPREAVNKEMSEIVSAANKAMRYRGDYTFDVVLLITNTNGISDEAQEHFEDLRQTISDNRICPAHLYLKSTEEVYANPPVWCEEGGITEEMRAGHVAIISSTGAKHTLSEGIPSDDEISGAPELAKALQVAQQEDGWPYPSSFDSSFGMRHFHEGCVSDLIRYNKLGSIIRLSESLRPSDIFIVLKNTNLLKEEKLFILKLMLKGFPEHCDIRSFLEEGIKKEDGFENKKVLLEAYPDLDFMREILLCARRVGANMQDVMHPLQIDPPSGSPMEALFIEFGIIDDRGRAPVFEATEEVMQAVRDNNLAVVNDWLDRGGRFNNYFLADVIQESSAQMLHLVLAKNNTVSPARRIDLDSGFGVGMGNGLTFLEAAYPDIEKVRILLEYGARELFYDANGYGPDYHREDEIESRELLSLLQSYDVYLLPPRQAGPEAVVQTGTSFEGNEPRDYLRAYVVDVDLLTASKDDLLQRFRGTLQDVVDGIKQNKTAEELVQLRQNNRVFASLEELIGELTQSIDTTDNDPLWVAQKIGVLQEQVEKLEGLLTDPITMSLMSDPVLLPSGNTVDASTVEQLYSSGNNKDPFSRAILEYPLKRNILLQRLIGIYNTFKYDLERFRNDPDRCMYVGEAVRCDTYGELPMDKIVYVLGPLCNSRVALRMCYRNIFNAFQAGSISIPVFNTGEGKIPLEDAAKIALDEIYMGFSHGLCHLDVTIVCHNEEQERVYRELLETSELKEFVTIRRGSIEDSTTDAIVCPMGAAFRPNKDTKPTREALEDAGPIANAVQEKSGEELLSADEELIVNARDISRSLAV